MAERNLANARLTEVDSRTALLQSAAALVYAAGSEAGGRDWTSRPRPPPLGKGEKIGHLPAKR